jgi:hypothetical protein
VVLELQEQALWQRRHQVLLLLLVVKGWEM